MKNILLLCGILILFFSACDDDDDGQDPNPPGNDSTEVSVRERLVRAWNITGLEINEEDRTLNSQDKATFKEDGTYTMTLPELNFVPTSGSWELTDNDKKVSINNDNVSYTFDINELTDKKMVLQLNYDNFKKEDIIYILTMEKP